MPEHMTDNEEYLQSILTGLACIQNSSVLHLWKNSDTLKEYLQRIDTEVWEVVDHIQDIKEDI